MVVQLCVREHYIRQQNVNAGGRYGKSIYSQQNLTYNYNLFHLPRRFLFGTISPFNKVYLHLLSCTKYCFWNQYPPLPVSHSSGFSCLSLRTHPSAAQMSAIDSALLRSLLFRCGRTHKWRLWKIRTMKTEPLRLSEELQHSDCQLARGAKGQTGWVGYQATPSLSFPWRVHIPV